MQLTRRSLMGALAALASARPSAAQSTQPFDHRTLVKVARDLASRAYRPRPDIPVAWTNMTYDQYRLFWFREADALFTGTDAPLRVDLLHPGLYYSRGVRIDLVRDGQLTEVPFDFSLFDRTDQAPDLPMDDTLGYSGLRLRAGIEAPGIFSEFAVFQGGSYFRAIAAGLTYGVSARGLALGTGSPEGEEFPDFTRLVVQTPEPHATTFVLHALMDSPSVAGAYRFAMTPGDPTVIEVTSTLFARRPLSNVGLAPLTSMFLFDETNRNRFDDFRPAVHDNDGLAMLNGNGEALWRPLANHRSLQVSEFLDDNPRGFGLMQRARQFEDFADLEARYENRPGLWIEPLGDWGQGSVTLVEIPTDKEFYDNIVAYWRPAAPLEPGRAHTLAYRMIWAADPMPRADPVLRVMQTRMGRGANGEHVVTVDFAPQTALGDMELMTARVALSTGALLATKLQVNPATKGPRLAFTFDPGARKSIEMRALVERDQRRISEVWLYRWTI